jgi:two-component system invasion response regulator UvrY
LFRNIGSIERQGTSKAIKENAGSGNFVTRSSNERNEWLETAKWLCKEHSQIRIVILSMFIFDLTLVSLLNNGVKAFLRKDIDEKELQKTIYDVKEHNFHFSNNITPRHLTALYTNREKQGKQLMLSEKEERFLQLASSELTYKEIADNLSISERSVDKLRNNLFERLNAKSRVGMTITAVKNGIIDVG